MLLHAERGGRVWLVERAPDAQRRPLDVATEDAAGNLGEARSPAGELAPELGIQLHVQRRGAVTSDFVRVRLVIVKDDRAAGADALLPSRALDVASAKDVGEERCRVPVLRQLGHRLVDGFERVESGLCHDAPNAPGRWLGRVGPVRLLSRRGRWAGGWHETRDGH